MKICVVGAGAIGGMMGAKLALAGEDVTLIARGAHLEAIRQNGLKLIEEDGAEHVARQVKATSRLSEAGAQDIVILALKAHQVEPIAAELPALFGPDTIVVTTQNGIPWWYFQKHGGEFEGRRVETVDPSGTLMASVEVERILGCVVFPAAEIVSPGVVRVIEGNRFPVGELDGTESERVKMVAALFAKAGFKSPVLKNVRGEIWLKLWGNLSFNPISALTHSTLVDICQFPLTRQLAANMMTEAQTIANKLGIEFRVSLEKRIAGAENVGKHKTSMLQDIEIGRAIEIDALVGAVVELGRLTQTPTPHIDAVYACVKLLAKTLAEEKGKLKVEKVG
ncbi:MAG TPA: 2-dehydropantoate 2-reductase [Acidiferrobacterales bacterium]|nr:2-dehydropantoate 2-reductase [Acidiferrobacterales bacterium]